MTYRKREREGEGTYIISLNPILIHFQPQMSPATSFFLTKQFNQSSYRSACLNLVSFLFFVSSWDKKNKISNYFCKLQCKQNFVSKPYVVLQNNLLKNWHVLQLIFSFKLCFSFDIFYPVVFVCKLFPRK